MVDGKKQFLNLEVTVLAHLPDGCRGSETEFIHERSTDLQIWDMGSVQEKPAVISLNGGADCPSSPLLRLSNTNIFWEEREIGEILQHKCAV